MRKIGIMGGTFNPIHIGHLIAAQTSYEALNLDEIIFIPSGDPPHKTANSLVPAEQRFKMVKIAVEDNKNFSVCNMEINRPGKTYTYDTLLELRKLYPDDIIYFIIGYDTLKEMDSWKDIKSVFKLCRFIVVNRGNTTEDLYSEIKRKKENYNAQIEIVKIPNIEISSTEIRDKVAEGKSIKYYLPEKVISYIENNTVYIRSDIVEDI